MQEEKTHPPEGETLVREEWWRLPFDETTNFSLLGFFIGGSHWTWNREKTADMTLDE